MGRIGQLVRLATGNSAMDRLQDLWMAVLNPALRKLPTAVFTQKGSLLTSTGDGEPSELLAGKVGQTPVVQADGTLAYATPSAGGTVTTAAPVTGTGAAASPVTLAASGVTAGSYGSSTAIPVIGFDVYGRATSATTAAVSTLPIGSAWWVHPTSADAFDDEFDTGSSLNVAWTQGGTLSGTAIDPFASFATANTSRQSHNVLRPGWWLIQSGTNNDSTYIYKSVTLNTNDLFYARCFASEPPGGATMGNPSTYMYLTDNSLFATNYLGIRSNVTGASIIEWSASGIVGTPASVALSTMALTDMAIQKVGTRYYIWFAVNGQGWRQLSTGTSAAAYTRLVIGSNNNGAPAANWGNPLAGFDYVRRIQNSATALPWPT